MPECLFEKKHVQHTFFLMLIKDLFQHIKTFPYFFVSTKPVLKSSIISPYTAVAPNFVGKSFVKVLKIP